MDFKGKVALITGGGNGIGRATALGFARNGAKVVVVDRDTAGCEGTAGIIRQQGGEATFVTADVTKSTDVQAYVKAALDAYGSIDCFHNNAGIEGSVAPTAEYDEDMFDTVMAVNVKGVFLGLRHVLPVMLKQKHGAIVNTASVAGLVASPGMPAYVASKHAVIGLTKTSAGEVARSGCTDQRGVSWSNRYTHDPLAGIHAQSKRPEQRGGSLPVQHPDRPLRHTGGGGQPRAVPLFRPRRQYHGRAVCGGWRTHCDGRCGDEQLGPLICASWGHEGDS